MLRNARRASRFVPLVVVLLCAQVAGAAAQGVVNINTASAEQLTLLPRIGPAVAQRIIEFRDQNGKFEQASDLILVRGIGDRTFEVLQPYVTVSGETSLKEKVQVSREGGSSGWSPGDLG
jgi:competence ComEA-like helix-hairpin-helix protein